MLREPWDTLFLCFFVSFCASVMCCVLYGEVGKVQFHDNGLSFLIPVVCKQPKAPFATKFHGRAAAGLQTF